MYSFYFIQIRAFKSFIRDYGTHFLSSAFLGAKISAVTYFTAFEKLKNGARYKIIDLLAI